MATMIPPMLCDGAPRGERVVYEALRDHPHTDGWVVWHGLAIRHHSTQVQGEADFVVVVPEEGALVVEIKSHATVDVGDDGLWRLGSSAPTLRSPYTQANDNKHSLRAWCTARTGMQPGYPIWSAVWFTHVGGEVANRLEQRIDVPAKGTLTRADLSPDRMVDRIVAVLRHGRIELERHMPRFAPDRPDADDIADLRGTLAPAVRMAASPKILRDARQADLDRATARQEEALEYVSTNPRLLVTGAAGTGKTNVAVRAAQQQANREERVLLTCFNRLLEDDLASRLRDRDDIVVARVHKIMLELTGLRPPPHADDAWWNTTLPAAALAVSKAPGFEPPYTCLVADEAQDLARDATLDVLDSLLVGGLDTARCVLAGDFGRQDIFRPSDSGDGLRRIRSRIPDATEMTLPCNVRQTPQLVDFIERIVDDEVYRAANRSADDGTTAQIAQYADESAQQVLFAQALEQLRDEGWRHDEIAVLSPRRDSAAKRAVAAGSATDLRPDGIHWSTIHAFKGLERGAVIITDVDDHQPHWLDLLYVGMTRATDRLIVLTESAALAERGTG